MVALLGATGLLAAGTVPATATASTTTASTTTASTTTASSIASRAGAERPDPVRQQLQAALDEIVSAGASGTVLRVDDGRRSYQLASGQARLDPPLAMRPDARFRAGSITKSFVATLVLQLVGEGRLSLDDTVERWQPGLLPGGDQITVRQLLNHTSGLFNYTEDPAFLPQVLNDPLTPLTPQDLVAVANAHPPVFAPGTDWSYSNTNYIVAGLILERVTGRSVSALIEQRIAGPLGLDDTYLPINSAKIRGYHARGYLPPSLTGAGYQDFTEVTASWAGAAGALISTTDDLHQYYRALLGGKLLRPAQLAQMKTLEPALEGFGYGLGLYQLDLGCGTVWGHDGSTPGYQTIAWYDESGRRGITINLPTQPDEPIAIAFSTLVNDVLCGLIGVGAEPGVAAKPGGVAESQDTPAAKRRASGPVPGPLALLVDPVLPPAVLLTSPR